MKKDRSILAFGVIMVSLIATAAVSFIWSRTNISPDIPFEQVQARFLSDLKYKKTQAERRKILSDMFILELADGDQKISDQEADRIREAHRIFSEAINFISRQPDGTQHLDNAGALYADEKLKQFLAKKWPPTSP